MIGLVQIWEFWTEYLINEQLAKISVLVIRNRIDRSLQAWEQNMYVFWNFIVGWKSNSPVNQLGIHGVIFLSLIQEQLEPRFLFEPFFDAWQTKNN